MVQQSFAKIKIPFKAISQKIMTTQMKQAHLPMDLKGRTKGPMT